ncbi:hypothetical protein IM792_01315 [Mucilaginibacter sp. JRF]|uniref:HD domain-containing protein n=1 Tax=Mucilaginibacter sp. JRF TaxID=2780088 RepID=UPI00188291FA|nr:HD domain-containing protein [Mucilaginibacter sp. JRF]MBE9583078.1 hypothetical protein [Mucilaginibacter sp. JRF]
MTAFIIAQTKSYVKNLLSEHLPENMFFHNLQHTQDVVMTVSEIAIHEKLSPREQTVVTVAAWLHDTGYCFQYNDHEEASLAIAGTFLRQHQQDAMFVQDVLDCIAATKMPQQPNTQLQKILCDADLAHLASTDYILRATLLRQEWAAILGKQYTDDEWIAGNIEMLRGKPYFTTYGKRFLQIGRAANAAKLAKNL